MYLSPANDHGTLVKNGGGDFTYTAKDQIQWNFDSGGKLTTVVDPNGAPIPDVSWYGPTGTAVDWHGSDLALVAVLAKPGPEEDALGRGRDILLMFNANYQPRRFLLPPVVQEKRWKLFLDTAADTARRRLAEAQHVARHDHPAGAGQRSRLRELAASDAVGIGTWRFGVAGHDGLLVCGVIVRQLPLSSSRSNWCRPQIPFRFIGDNFHSSRRLRRLCGSGTDVASYPPGRRVGAPDGGVECRECLRPA